ncbi:MAG TPA: dihydrofolate reductase family protein [Nitrospira sp.]|nr:dihydrofolate reductase family protein [Nitrospira sp.]
MRLKTLYDSTGPSGRLTTELQALYDGDLVFPDPTRTRPFIIGNFVQSLDGVVSFKIQGHSGGGDISGRNEEDTFIMGLLRSCADAVLIGEETYRVAPGHFWTADFIHPKRKQEYQALRRRLAKRSPYPLTVIVSGKGSVDLDGALFRHSDVKTVVLTTKKGREHLEQKHGAALPADVQVLPGETVLHAGDMAGLLYESYGVRLLVHEGGPTLFAGFLRDDLIDELFLTIAPQIVGGGASGERPNFSGHLSFGPEKAMWTTLLSVKSANTGHLFLRYRRTP